ncbi:MAG: hypothetical protein GF401_11255 [Chitinivibrionales bacterium]|nr:hypothetical protein [Chitinivibrionales bacterium]
MKIKSLFKTGALIAAVLPAIIFPSLSHAESKLRPQFGVYYSQAAGDLFMTGIVQKNTFEKLPFQYFMQIGYAYDKRYRVEYKDYGHGVVMDNSVGPYLTLNEIKLGMFGGVFILFEAYKLTGVDAYSRERNMGLTTGAYCTAFEHISCKAGILQAWELSKFFLLWNDYPLSFYFSLLLTL